MSGSAEYLGEHGSFAQQQGFTVRSSQIEMAAAIEQAIAKRQTLIAESGTGTGKTFAYLVPAFLSAKKTLISTGTKHLQEQLFRRDIPRVLKYLGLSANVALLKGRSNYLCLQRLQQSRYSPRNLNKKTLAELESISNWLPTSASGDMAELRDVAEDSRVWPMVTSTIDNCLGKDCDYFDDCFVNKARKKALASDVVVINHHLYFADKSLKDDGFGSILPEVDTVIFDEAHQIPDIASHFLGTGFSTWQVIELINDVRLAEAKEKSLVADLLKQSTELEKQVADQRLSLGLSERRVSWQALMSEVPTLNRKLATLTKALDDYTAALQRASVAGEALMRCYERAIELALVCQHLTKNEAQDDRIRWVEIAKRTFRVHETPLNIGDELRSWFGNDQQVRIFTSATLSINHDFSHYLRLIGVSDQALTRSWDSPFDYYNQGVLYVPEGLPQPRDADFIRIMFDAVVPVLKASRGRAFVLFTSFNNMQRFADYLVDYDFNLLMQGQRNKNDLLQSFIDKPNSVLLGTMSFWEGVDVPGDSLSCVIIDKLPFESPSDPVLQARLNAMEQAGDNPFMHYQVPRAVITLRQGAGRLIRNQTDKGVLMICDSRLRGTRYGRIFLDSLPPMRRTDDHNKVCQFLNSHVENSDTAGD